VAEEKRERRNAMSEEEIVKVVQQNAEYYSYIDKPY